MFTDKMLSFMSYTHIHNEKNASQINCRKEKNCLPKRCDVQTLDDIQLYFTLHIE